ncbi:MAG: restriction endonuclease subunit S [Muribaculaceae bacterium]|nr:restriction endonuclease subunit S [Muribaculaceae bacterium]
MSHYGNLPDGWVEVSLGELFEIGSAKRVMKSDWQSEGIPFYRTREVVKLAENGDVNNDLFISHKLFDEMKTKFGVPQSGDIMLTAVGTIGIPYVVRESDLFYYKDASVLCLSNIYNLNSEFFKFVLLSQRLRKQMFSSSKGTTVDTITIEKASNYRVLLPPIEEQQRIVSAVDKIISIIDWAESEQKKLTDFIIIAKSKVLELAMQGKLVPQDPADEPAAEMLRRVNPKARIICDTPHYPQLPENWAITHLADVATLLSGRDLESSGCNSVNEGIPYLIGASNICNGCMNINRWTKHPQVVSSKNDILFSCKGTIGELLINDYGNIHIARQFMAIRCMDCIRPDYLRFAILNKLASIKKNANGIIPGISRQVLLGLTIFLPPMKEQDRILLKLKEIESYYTSIQQSLN